MENKYSIILGNLGNTCDRFCKSYKTNPSSEQMLELAAENMPYIGGVELVGTWDIRPDNAEGDEKSASTATVWSARRSSPIRSATAITAKAPSRAPIRPCGARRSTI